MDPLTFTVPEHRVIRIAGAVAPEWPAIAPLPPLWLASGGGLARHATEVRLAWDGARLHARFDCVDPDVWWTHAGRDAALWEEEVVEVFLALGEADPRAYAEFEVNPGGALFDAWIDNPDGRRDTLRAEVGWNCPGISWSALADRAAARWSAELAVPLAALAPRAATEGPWRANFCRIERPRGGLAEFSCWSPTLTDPADFHKPGRFGRLRFA